jgi:hypothetical protein
MNKRRPESYVRRQPTREAYDYVLIVCEGGKTEPNYFNRLKIVNRLSNANIKVTSAPGTDPMTIVRFVEEELGRDNYDRAYCVFDRNGHANFDQAVQTASHSRFAKDNRLFVVPSIPCFEIWILLHFAYSTAPYNSTPKLSACDQVIRDLRKHLPNYKKSYPTIFDETVELLDQAIKHAGRLCAHNRKSQSSNPATALHTLIEYLLNLKK